MAKAKQKRWACTQCDKVKLGKLRPRKDDIIRWCLDCSKKTGYLVPRTPVAKSKTKTKTKKAKTRKTARSWISNPRYQWEVPHANIFRIPKKINLMLAAEVLCKSSGWQRPTVMKELWKRTMNSNNGKSNDSNPIKVQRTYTTWESTGRAWFGVKMTASTCFVRSLNTLLHELCHVDQKEIAKVNGVRRPHDLTFNMQQFKMAKKLWGYDTHPEDAGWSIGKGYAPTRHLEQWMVRELQYPNSLLTKWILKHCVDTGTFVKPKTKTKTKTKKTSSRYSWELMYYDGTGDCDAVDLSKKDWKRRVTVFLYQWKEDVQNGLFEPSMLEYMPYFELNRWDSKTGDAEEFEIGTAQKKVSKMITDFMNLIPYTVQQLEEKLESAG